MLGITISERTVSRIRRSVPPPPSQRWKTFLHNHVGELVSIDFFSVPTVAMKVLFVFLVLGTSSSGGAAFQCDRASHCDLDLPTDCRGLRRSGSAAISDTRSGWCLRQRRSPADRVIAYWGSTHRTPESLAESVRRTPDRFHTKRLLNHFLILNARHVKRTLASYLAYYHETRTHLGVDKAMSISSASLEYGKDHRDSAARRHASPL